MQIRIETSEARDEEYFLWSEENKSHRQHLRGRFHDFGRLVDCSYNMLCFSKTTGIEFVHQTGRVIGPRARRGLTQTFLKDFFFLEIVTFTPTSMRSLTHR